MFSISEYADNQAIDNEIGLNENIVQQKSKRSSVVIKQMDSFEKELNDMLLNLNRLESKHSGRVPVASLPKLPDRSSTVSKIPMSLDRPGIVNRNSASFMSKSIISSPRSSIISNSNSEKRRLTRSVSFADMEPIHKSLPAQSTLDRVFRLTKQEQISVPKTPESTKGEYMQVKIAGEMMFSKRFCVLIDNVLYILKKRDV